MDDVRDPRSVADAMPGVDCLFHTAAIDVGVERVVCLPAEKTAYPINYMI